MKRHQHIAFLLTSLILLPSALLAANDEWSIHQDSVENPDVPKGEILTFTFDDSKVFPGTSRKIWVYVPAQYEGTQPACLYVCQDGIKYEATTVFDNLIHKGEMPITIGVFVAHGRLLVEDPETQVDRLNRSYEYDSVIDSYAQFLHEDLLPTIEGMKTSDGRRIHLSPRPTDRMIAGNSSGGIAALASPIASSTRTPEA